MWLGLRNVEEKKDVCPFLLLENSRSLSPPQEPPPQDFLSTCLGIDSLKMGHSFPNDRVCMHAKSIQLCLTLWDPTDCSSPGSSVPGISQTRIMEWVTISFSRGHSWPRDRTPVSCIAGGFFTTEPPGKHLVIYVLPYFNFVELLNYLFCTTMLSFCNHNCFCLYTC